MKAEVRNPNRSASAVFRPSDFDVLSAFADSGFGICYWSYRFTAQNPARYATFRINALACRTQTRSRFR